MAYLVPVPDADQFYFYSSQSDSRTRLYFDTRWRDVGDFHWALALMKNKVPIAVCNSFVSTFTDTSENMNLRPNAIREKQETRAMMPGWIKPIKPLMIFHHRLRRMAAGHFNLPPMSYEIYMLESPERRVKFDVTKPTAGWWTRPGTDL
jgi:hypothetical protein